MTGTTCKALCFSSLIREKCSMSSNFPNISDLDCLLILGWKLTSYIFPGKHKYCSYFFKLPHIRLWSHFPFQIIDLSFLLSHYPCWKLLIFFAFLSICFLPPFPVSWVGHIDSYKTEQKGQLSYGDKISLTEMIFPLWKIIKNWFSCIKFIICLLKSN